MIVRLLWLTLFFICSSSQADEFINYTRQPRIQSIDIIGLSRTEEYVVRRELTFKEGDILTTEALLYSIQELKNLQIFSYVRPFLELLPDNRIKLRIELEEKWSLIPFFSYSAGGNTEHIKAGIYDINVFGKYIEAGIQYDSWNGEDGGFFWYRNPRFMDTHTRTGIDFGTLQQPKNLYNTYGEKVGHFVIKRKQLNLLFDTEINRQLRLGLISEFSEDVIHSIEEILPEDPDTFESLNSNSQIKTLLNTLSISIGKLDFDIDLVKGKKSELLLSHSNSGFISDYTFSKIKWINQVYWQFPRHGYIAANFTIAATDTQLIQQHYNVGGFQHIRGYFDGQFRNRSYWQTNLEYRISSYRSSWIILQHVFFIDATNTANRIDELNAFDKNIYSAGTGIRLISPKIYSFNGRLDIALYTSGKSLTRLSLGTQHFF